MENLKSTRCLGLPAVAVLAAAAFMLGAGCANAGQREAPSDGGTGGRNPMTGTGGAGGSLSPGSGGAGAGTGGVVGATGSGGGITIPKPSEFTKADMGGYKLGAALPGDSVPGVGVVAGSDGCNVLIGVVRDFKGTTEPMGHPDFEAFQGCDVTPNLVAAALGADNKPSYASLCEMNVMNVVACPFGQMTTSKANFDQWYRFASGVNKPFVIFLQLEAQPRGNISTFASGSFFPLDGAGWGNSGQDLAGVSHNFGFTTEVHTKFQYKGGETFKFTGDDDLWVFINGKLAIDLGGLHPPADGAVDLDLKAGDLGLTKGGVYTMDLFHAERHTEASNFHIDTNFSFVNCGMIIP
jgi:fibro-slime domain-containing protein